MIVKFAKQHTKLITFWAFFTFFALCQWQHYIFLPGYGLDPSWHTSLGLVTASDSLFFGKDYAFTYGPAYFFMTDYMATSSVFTNFAIVSGLNFIFALLKTVLAYKLTFGFTAQSKFAKICKIAVIILLFSVDGKFFFPDFAATLVFFLLYDALLLLRDKQFKARHYLTGAVIPAIILSLLALIKFSFIAITVYVMLCMIGIFIYYKKFIALLASAVSFLLSGIAFWLAFGQKLEYFTTWLKYGLEQASGYTEAQATSSITWWPNVFLGLVFCIACAISWFAVLRTDKFKAFSLFIGISLLFLTWKESYVRADGHTFVFYSGMVLVLAYITYVVGKEPFTNGVFSRPDIRKLYGVGLAASAICIVVMNGFSISNGIYNGLFYDASLTYRSAQKIDIHKEILRMEYNYFAPFADSIAKEETVDIIPWDISLIYAYDLNYNPRLSVQSYSNYTAILDAKTADGFRGADAPDKVIWSGYNSSLLSIDERYAIFDEPQTFRTLLNNYSVIGADLENMLLLEHTDDKELTENIIIAQKARLGDNITIPQSENGYVYMSINADTTLFGKLMTFVFKMPSDYITITTADGEEHTFTFTRKVASNGLYVTSFIKNLADLESAWSGKMQPDIVSIRIDGNPLFYKDEFEVLFSTYSEAE